MYISCGVHSDNFAVQTPNEVGRRVEGQVEDGSSSNWSKSCGEERRPSKEEYFLEPALASPRSLVSQPSQTSWPGGCTDICNLDRSPGSGTAIGKPGSLVQVDPHKSGEVASAQSDDVLTASALPTTEAMHVSGSMGVVDGGIMTDPYGKFMDSARTEGKHGHKTRGEAMDPADPVFSAVASQVQVPSGEPLVGYGNIGKDGFAARSESLACEGPGVKACKHTIPKGTQAPNDEWNEDAEVSGLAGRGKSDQQPIGFRPDLSEPVVTPQPVGFRPDLSEPVVTPQPVGFRPDLAEPVVTSQPVGFRPDFPEPVGIYQSVGSRPESANQRYREDVFSYAIPVGSSLVSSRAIAGESSRESLQGTCSIDPSWAAHKSVFTCSVEVGKAEDGEWIGYSGRVDPSHNPAVPPSYTASSAGGDSVYGEPRIHAEPCESVDGECSDVVWFSEKVEFSPSAGPSEPEYRGRGRAVDMVRSSCLPKGSGWLHDAKERDSQGPEIDLPASFPSSVLELGRH